MLNCVISFKTNAPLSCDSSDVVVSAARKLTSDLFPSIINNAYFKPSPNNPYYRVMKNNSDITNITLNSILNPCNNDSVNITLDLRCGDTDKYVPEYVYIDYLKTPNLIKLSYEDLESESDNTPVMEFPDYICYEIINEFVKLLLENSSDPRLQTNIPINQSIGYSMQNNK